jgi:hypothetical protein
LRTLSSLLLCTSDWQLQKVILPKRLQRGSSPLVIHLPNISDLLVQLNDARKAEAYGDIARPDLDPAELGRTLHRYVSAVEAFLAQ